MKNTEVRIGNYVHYQINDKFDERKQWNEVTRIDPIDFECFDKYYLPIELTEEWLFKFGFVKTECTTNWHRNNNIKAYQYTLEYFFIFYGTYSKKFGIGLSNIWDGMDLEISSVHQLQNLYFALTEKELEVKL